MTTDGRHLLNGGKLPLIAPDLLGEILASASDLALLIAPSRRIVSVLVNPHHRSFGQLTDWEGSSLKDVLAEGSLRKLEARLADMQSARRGDVDPLVALGEIEHTVNRATELANQMLSLAKVEQLRQQDDAPVLDWAEVVRAVALDLAPLIAERQLDFSLDIQPAPVRAHEWALRELVRKPDFAQGGAPTADAASAGLDAVKAAMAN